MADGDAIRVLLLGGHTQDYHQFSVMGPIYARFLTDAGFDVTLSEDRDDLLDERLEPFGVIAAYTTRGTLTEAQSDGLLGAVAKGKGFVGLHSATCSFLDNDAYLRMVGARFLTHPHPPSEFAFHVERPSHPIVQGVEDFRMVEELYLLETYGSFELLLSTTYKGIRRPLAWAKGYGMGRVAYIALGHGPEQTENRNYQRLVINAVRWARDPDA